MSQLSRLPDMRARDIRRRVEVIQKKLSDLQELDIPCAFCYSSARNTGSLFTLGDRRITDVMERHKNEILRNLIENKPESPNQGKQEIHLILPPLPGPLPDLSRGTMQSLVVGILKDLGIRWSDPKPQWWPTDVPFFSPRAIPDTFKGNWTQALRRIVESVYSFFSYDVGTYIAGSLEVDDTPTEEGEREGGTASMDNEGEEENEIVGEGGGAREGGGVRKMEGFKEEGGEGRGARDELEYDDEETDDATSGLEYDTSTEEDTFEESRSPDCGGGATSSTSLIPDADSEKSKSSRIEHSATANHRGSSSSHKPLGSPSHPSTDTAMAHSGFTNNKTISSFTVENILMGNTSRSNSTSSGSPTSASHSSNNTFLTFPPTPQSGTGSTPASPASANWTSHPPVKYTKFTMMSPSSMRIGGDKRRKGERDKTVTTTTTTTSAVDGSLHRLQAPSNALSEGMAHQVTKCKEEPKSPSAFSVSMHPSSMASAPPHFTYHHSVIQTAMPSTTASSLSRQSSSQSVAAAGVASPRLVPVSPSPFSRVQNQSPHPQQQYVVFFPPNVALMATPTADLQVFGQTAAGSPQLYIQGATTAAAFQQANGNHVHKRTPPHLSSSSPSPPPTNLSTISSSAVLSSSNNLRLFRTSSNPSFGPSHKLSTDSHFHSRADKSQAAALMRKMGSRSLVPAERSEGGKGIPKQKKLRFHMTTIVKKVRRRSSSVSLTAPPPTLCNRPPPDDVKRREQEKSAAPPNSAQNSGQKPTTTSTESIATATSTGLVNHASTDPSSNNNSNDATPYNDETSTRPPHSSDSQADLSSQQSSLHTTDHRKYENRFPPISNSSATSVVSITGPTEEQASNGRGRGRGRGRRARGYTRRKRELTFHLYEDPYRAKRTRQQN